MEKKQRSVALSNFTRNLNTFNGLLDDAAPRVLVTPQFNKLQGCWEKLEEAHDKFMEATDIDIDTDKDGLAYIDGPSERHQAALYRYSSYLKTVDEVEHVQLQRKADEDRGVEEENRKRVETETKAAESLLREEQLKTKFDSAKAELTSGIDAFKRLNLNLKDSIGDASDADKRHEWQKIEVEFQSLKNQIIKVAGMDHTQDVTEINNKFVNDAEKIFVDMQKWMLSELRNSPSIIGGTATVSDRSTRKESVRLPSFKGDEKESPFLKFPIWKKQWEVVIVEYEEKWRAGLLWDHVDEAARGKFVGYETDYREALKRLDSFYGDPLKVVSCVMKEVMSPHVINDGDYKGLISYGVVLENNFNRLKSMSLEHEMSNTSTMSLILRKFPCVVGEKWTEYLSLQALPIKAKPFPSFVAWLISQKEIWERMDAVDVTKGKSHAGRSSTSFYGEEFASGSRMKCFLCGEEGHKRRFCPKKNDSRDDSRKPKKRTPKIKKYWCAFHKEDSSRRCSTVSCQDLRKMVDSSKRIQLLKDNGDCCHCCGDHKPADCSRKDRVCGGGKDDRGCAKTHNIHELFCSAAKVCFSVQEVHSANAKGDDSEGVVLSIMNVKSSKKGAVASVFWDLGCTSNFVREAYAKLCCFKGFQENLSVKTLGGVVTDYCSVTTYKCYLRDVDGALQVFDAYGLESITGALTQIEVGVIRRLFPHLDDQTISSLKRASNVDFLIGMKHPSWHPERAERAKDGGDLWLYRGRFGVCIGGRHPQIEEGTRRSDSLFSVKHTYHADVLGYRVDAISHELEFCPKRCAGYKDLKSCANVPSGVVEPLPSSVDVAYASPTPSSDAGLSSSVEVDVGGSLDSAQSTCIGLVGKASPEPLPSSVDMGPVHPTSSCFGTKTAIINEEEMFFQLESLGTMVEPKCGGCRCSKCPVPGSKYSFKEQKEFDIIQKNLFYNDFAKRWFTEYPWKCSRSDLPKNENIALQCLMALEKRLLKDPELAQDFCSQIQDMVDRGVAVILMEEELSAWKKDYYYLPLIGVKGKKKWLRVCFDASRRQGGCRSMNDCLYKGPDRFMNNLLSVIIGFRNGRIGCAADISKFHNQVHLVKIDVHMQRFLWRDMKLDETPHTYAVKVNNFGVKPANCIATCALHKSADQFADVYPVECQDIKEQTYIDDELVAAENKEEALSKTKHMDEISEHAGMPNKGWTFTGDDKSASIQIGSGKDEPEEKVLGLLWDPKTDMFNFQVKLKLKRLHSDKVEEIEVCSEDDLENLTGVFLTRRILLSNVSKIFDPVGFLCPITLQAKLLMRETWCDKALGWDDPLPDDQQKRWWAFLKSLLSLKEVHVPRSLWPEGEVKGCPVLVIFSDGSTLAYGVAAYARWQLSGGGYWSRLIMSKSKIAPKRMVSVPRMELCGAVVGNRIKNFLQKETNLQFSKVYHLVDSSTVLGYVHKESGIFGPYEGVRIAEIQSSNEFRDGRLAGWAWVPGCDNPADWCTKPRTVKDITEKDFFYSGPPFLQSEEEDWPIKFSYRIDKLEGELENRKQIVCAHVHSTFPDVIGRLINRCSLWNKVVRVLAWILRLGRPSGPLDCEEIKRAKLVLVKYVQKEIELELVAAANSGKGRFRKLAPMQDEDGVWRVGSRMRNLVPFTVDSKMPKILPTHHKMTLLIMRSSHEFSHSGQDGTLSRFHAKGYWAVRAGHLAKTVKQQCVTCRKISRILLSQPLGEFSIERLQDPVAWGFCQLDLFGPFHCRGDVNPRTTKKTWVMIIVDANSGAVHLDIVQDYSTHAVLLSLRRFGSLRGWPGIICSDPGSQLESAGGKLVNWWVSMGDSLRSLGSTKNFKWEISPPDSPWRQGKAERHIAIVKKLLTISIGDSRLTPVELQTILMEVSNICNERPIGLSKPREDGTYTLITPNQLLLGRSSNVLPDDAKLVSDLPMVSRYRLVHHVTSIFWKNWSSEVSPGLVHRPKWHKKGRNLRVRDLVMICEPTKIKAKYRLGVVDDVKTSNDGCVRSATIRYVCIQKNPRGEDKVQTIRVRRSVQRLSLILPVEEQSTNLEVKEHDFYVECTPI